MMSAWCDVRHVIKRLDWHDLIGSFFQVSGHGEQHVRGPAHPELGLLEQVHAPLLRLQLLLGVLLERNHPTTPYQGSIHPPSHVWGVCQNQDCVQVTNTNNSVELFVFTKFKLYINPCWNGVPTKEEVWNKFYVQFVNFCCPFRLSKTIWVLQ